MVGAPGKVTPVMSSDGIFHLQPRPIPDVGFAQAQMHVVFDDSRAPRAERAGDGETIAARNGGRFVDIVCRRGVFCVLQSLRGKRRRRQKRPVHRSVETRAPREQKIGHRLPERFDRVAASPLGQAVRLLQRQIHGVGDKDRVLRQPGLGLPDEQQIFERRRREIAEPPVHARDIGVQDFALPWRYRGQHGGGAMAEAMQARGPVRR